MSKRLPQGAVGHIQSHFDRREQRFCLEALESGEFDGLTDDAWVKLCEGISKDGKIKEADAADQTCLESVAGTIKAP
mgnify:CR=1 FL=1